MEKEKRIGYKYGYVVIDGVFYEHKMKDGKTTLKKLPERRLNKEIKIAEEITEKLERSADVNAILMEAVMKLEDKERMKLHNMLHNSKKRYIPKTRKDYCVDMKIGNFILPLID